MEFSRLSSKGQITVPRRIRDAIGAKPGDTLAYEVRGPIVTLRRIDPVDLAFHAALEGTLDEWASSEDDEAFGDL